MNYNKSYPKDFRNEKIIIEKKKCFFIMPFAEQFDLLFGILKEMLLKNGYQPVRVDNFTGSIAIMNKIMNELLSSQYIIVDLSGLNANVFYELGIAHCFKDSRNVILIKDKNTKEPSDIKHINYIEYDRNNFVLLKEQIRQTLEDIRYISELESVLSFHQIVSNKNYNSEIIEIIEKSFCKDEILLICDILNKDINETNDSKVELLIKKYIEILVDLDNNRFELIYKKAIINLFIKILVYTSEFKFIPSQISALLSQIELFSNQKETLEFRTNLSLELAKSEKHLDNVMPWIIEYFSQSKSTHIDLNRYSIEAFLLTTLSKEVNNYIINALFASDRHIREHISDIIGEKRLIEAHNNLLVQLNRETNIYTAASLMEAIGKIGYNDDIFLINKWIENHYEEINNPGGNFVFKHAKNAILALDISQNNQFSVSFIDKYRNNFYIDK